MIKATVIADSICPRGNRLTTLEVIMPRYILAEFNTHRMKTRNSASSRAIPFKKMVQSVKDNPFIPYAWQKDHKGMQGKEYLDTSIKYGLSIFISSLISTLNTFEMGSKEYEELDKEIEEKIELIRTSLNSYQFEEKYLDDWWLLARDKAIESACILYVFRVTKQLANRLLEPFMYHKVLVSATEWDNFFNLRCPQYSIKPDGTGKLFKSRKDILNKYGDPDNESRNMSNIDWLQKNQGQADIHMMFLAEAIYDARNESIPKELKEGEWHIPYINYIKDTVDLAMLASNNNYKYNLEELFRKISVARCARLSYQTLGDNPEINYEKDLELYETLFKSGHFSPFEHVARVMTEDEYNRFIKGEVINEGTEDIKINIIQKESQGWCLNYRGFIQERYLLEQQWN